MLLKHPPITHNACLMDRIAEYVMYTRNVEGTSRLVLHVALTSDSLGSTY